MPGPGDGFRVFVDRLWPRGLSHDTFKYDLWEKELAPSQELRQWFHADPEARGREFESRYEAELAGNPALKPFIESLRPYPTVTFLYGSRDKEENNAVVLRKVVLNALNGAW